MKRWRKLWSTSLIKATINVKCSHVAANHKYYKYFTFNSNICKRTQRRCRGTLSQNRTKMSSNPEAYLPALKWIGPKILEPVESTHILSSTAATCSRRWGLFRCSRDVTSAFSLFILYSCTSALDAFFAEDVEFSIDCSLAFILFSSSLSHIV